MPFHCDFSLTVLIFSRFICQVARMCESLYFMEIIRTCIPTQLKLFFFFLYLKLNFLYAVEKNRIIEIQDLNQ